MLKITDTVKVIAKTNCGGIIKELIPVGTICIIVSEHKDKYGSIYYGVTPLHNRNDLFYYLESELEKGSLQWVKKSESPSGSEENGHVVWVTAKPTACQKLLDEAEKIDHFSDKFGEVFLDAFMEADNGCYEMAKGILNTFYECKTDRDFQIANHMLMGICGYTAETLLERIEKRESEGFVWESC